MGRVRFLPFAGSVILWSHLLHVANAHSSGEQIVTAAQVNGTWRSKTGTFKIWALGKQRQRLQVEFSGVYKYKTSDGLMANTGEGSGIPFIKKDTAMFRPHESDEDCKIIMKISRSAEQN